MTQVAIHMLHLATVRVPPGQADAGELEVLAYLIRHPHGLFLVDTGIGSGNAVIDQRFAPDRHPVPDALRPFGLATGDISAVINSHLHFDHCGNNRLFAGIPTYMQRAELEAARAPAYTVREWFEFDGARIELIAGDHEIVPGLKLLATPGHTPGHQSVAIQCEGRLKLIAAQAAYCGREFEAGGDAGQAHEGLAQLYLSTIARLKSLGPAEIYFSHDRRTWRA